MKKNELHFLIFMSFLFILAIAIIYHLSSDSNYYLKITDILRIANPFFMYLILILSLFFLIKFFLSIKRKSLSSMIKNRNNIALFLIFIFAFIFINLHPSKTQRIYYDEDIYLNVAQNIALLNKAQFCNEGEFHDGKYNCLVSEYNKEPSGYPFILSLIFKIFGVNPEYGFILNRVLFALSVTLLYSLSNLLFKSKLLSFITAFSFFMLPMNHMWFSTCSSEGSATFLPILALTALFKYIREKNTNMFYFSLFIAIFAVQIRPESLMFLAIYFSVLFVNKVPKKILIASIFIALILLLPHLTHLISTSKFDWGAGAERNKLSLEHLKYNLQSNTLFYLDINTFPILITIFFIVGLLSKIRDLKFYPIFTWFFAFWGIFLVFYAGSYNFGADVRFSLMSYAPICIIATQGINLIWKKFKRKNIKANYLILILVLLIVQLIYMLPTSKIIGEEGWMARFDHQFTEEIAAKLPRNSIILTHVPTTFHLQGVSASQVHNIFNIDKMKWYLDYYDGGVFFWYGYWCTINDPNQSEVCNYIHKKYQNSIYLKFKERKHEYILYKIISIKE